ncbi:MAG: hypothetical protein R3A79_03125 [Nannocystaceae bacterium]
MALTRRAPRRRRLRPLWGAVVALAIGCAPLTHAGFERRAPLADAPLPERARIFLVAGGVDVANFAAEVIEQRRFWRAQGFADDAIACYYARPTKAGFRGDRRQYRRLFRALEGCYAASTATVRAHLAAAAERRPPFLYLYVTTHGVDSLVGDSGDALPPDERSLLDRYVLQLGEGPGAGARAPAIVAAYRDGAPREELLFTPDVLADALARFPAETPKLVVLQGCHSGGFLAEPRGRAAEIQRIPNLTAIASARYDRTSFGCDAGPDRTYFGALFAHLLRGYAGRSPPEIPWRTLFAELRAALRELEERKGVRASLPVFFTSRVTDGAGAGPDGGDDAADDASPVGAGEDVDMDMSKETGGASG